MPLYGYIVVSYYVQEYGVNSEVNNRISRLFEYKHDEKAKMSDLHIKLCFIGYGWVMYAILYGIQCARVCRFEMKRICIYTLYIDAAFA